MKERRDDASCQHEALRATMTGYKLSQALYVVAKLQVADLLAGGVVRDADALAVATETEPDSLRRLLLLLTAAGYFAHNSAGAFGLTGLGELLVSDAESSDWAWIIKEGELWREAWDRLLDCVRTGVPGFNLAYGAGLFDHLARDGGGEVARRTLAALSSSGSDAQVEAILDAYDAGTATTVVDLGGGNGVVLFAALARHPGLRGVLFDLPYVVDLARPPAAVADRCALVGGSFFDAVPEGAGELYLLRSVLHDWDDERAGVILAACRRAVGRGARLLVIEVLATASAGEDGLAVALRDVNLMVMTSGRKRTADELEGLLEAAGFELRRTLPTAGTFSILEAV